MRSRMLSCLVSCQVGPGRPEMNRIQLVLFGMQNRDFGSYARANEFACAVFCVQGYTLVCCRSPSCVQAGGPLLSIIGMRILYMAVK
jgi:hypothetical protein